MTLYLDDNGNWTDDDGNDVSPNEAAERTGLNNYEPVDLAQFETLRIIEEDSTMDVIKEQAKVRLLRETADNIDSKKFNYNWLQSSQCNLGCILNTLNKTKPYPDFRGVTYSQHIVMCQTSNQPFDAVVQQLLDFGFTPKELFQIELADIDLDKHLEDPNNFIPAQFSWYEHPQEDVIANASSHLRSIADEIEAKVISYQSQGQKSSQPVPVKVGE